MNVFVKISFIFFTLCLYLPLLGQEQVEGIVFDKDTKQRVARVLVSNISLGANSYNNTRGEFKLPINKGDKLVFQKENYFSDTLIYNDEKVIVVNLKRTSIYIDPVTVVARKTPEEILNQRKIDYNKAYRLADPGSLLSVGQNGAGLSINAVYNYFSREGKNARRLTAYFQREYEDNIIELRFSKDLIRNVTGLEGEPLDNFIVRYKPSYNFVMQANHYDMVNYIKSKYEFFKHVPYIKPLPDLNNIELN